MSLRLEEELMSPNSTIKSAGPLNDMNIILFLHREDQWETKEIFALLLKKLFLKERFEEYKLYYP